MLEAFEGGVRLKLYVQPNGQVSEILGEHNGALKIRIQAPPVEGKANAEVEAFLARLAGVPRKNVSIVRGAQSRLKTAVIQGITLAEMRAALARARVTAG